ncbi:MAG: universal stress protein [Candidatus Melainabacteria bacterium]|nr:universal stress protein [Candidatus Melainabacteria bacterium]
MKIIVAVDGSECSDNAVNFVAEHGWKAGTRFMVLSIIQPPPREFNFLRQTSDVPTTYEEKIATQSKKIASKAAERLEKELSGFVVEQKVESGPVAETIVRVARSWQADLIVVGSHGRTGVEKILLGSVAEEIVKTAPCSVEVIRECTHG